MLKRKTSWNIHKPESIKHVSVKVSIYKFFVQYILLTFFQFDSPFGDTTVDMATYMFWEDTDILIFEVIFITCDRGMKYSPFLLSVYIFMFNKMSLLYNLFKCIDRVRVHISIPSYGNNSLHMPVLCSYFTYAGPLLLLYF